MPEPTNTTPDVLLSEDSNQRQSRAKLELGALREWKKSQEVVRKLSKELDEMNGAGSIEQEAMARRIHVAISRETASREEYIRLGSVADNRMTRCLSFVGAGLGILLTIVKLIEHFTVTK